MKLQKDKLQLSWELCRWKEWCYMSGDQLWCGEWLVLPTRTPAVLVDAFEVRADVANESAVTCIQACWRGHVIGSSS